MCGRDAVRKSDSQGEHFTGIHDRFLRDPVYRESQLAIGWSEQKCKEWDELAKEDHTYKLTGRGKEKIQRTMLPYSEQSRQKWVKWSYDLITEPLSWWKNRLHQRIRRTNWRAHPSRTTKTHTTRTRSFLWRLPVQRSSWSTYRMTILVFNFRFIGEVHIRMELEKWAHNYYLFYSNLFFVSSGFRLQLIAIHCNRRDVWTERPLTSRIFLVHVHTLHPCSHAPHGSRCRTTCLHKRALIHMSSRVWLCVVSPPIDLFLFSECLLLSILFISSILVIILHVVETDDY